MNSYEISAKLETVFGEGENTNATISIMSLMRACEVFGIEFSWDDAVKGTLYGHVGHYEVSPGREVWFILRDSEEIKDGAGRIRYTLYEGGQQVASHIE